MSLKISEMFQLVFSSVQSLSRVRIFAAPWTVARQASLSVAKSRSLLKLMSIESVMPSSHLILCHSLFLLPSIFPSIRVFSNESILCIWWPKYWTFSLSISPSNEYSVFIYFRVYWLDLLNGKPLQYSCLGNSMNSMKRQLVLPWKILLGLTLPCAFSLDSNLGLNLSLFSLSSWSFHYYINESPELWQLDFFSPFCIP